MNSVKNVCIFDFDGVLALTAELCYKSLVVVFERVSIKPPSFEEYLIGFNPTNKHHFFTKRGVTLTEVEIFTIFESHFQKQEIILHPSILVVLSAIRSQGYKIAIASANSNVQAIMKALRKRRVTGLFDHIDGFCLNDKSEYIIQICERFGYEPEHSVMVGDSPHDMHAGKKAGLKHLVALGWHECLQQPLLSSPHDYFISRLEQLPRVLIGAKEYSLKNSEVPRIIIERC